MSFTGDQRDFFKKGHVRVIVPRSSEHLDRLSKSSISILDAEQRDRLFIDERLKVFVVLRLPHCDEAELKSHLSRLVVGVDVWASDESEASVRSTTSPAANQDLIFSQQLQQESDPIVLITKGDDEQVYVNLVWETIITIHRARVRLAEPRITIIPNASIPPLPTIEASDKYLEPFAAQEVNVFESLHGARGFEDDAPYLPASRLQIVLPRPAPADSVFHFQSVPSTAFKITSVATPRLKYTRAWGKSTSLALTASLDVEILSLADTHGTIETAKLELTSGTVEDLTSELLPLQCHSKDCVTFLYNLHPQHSEFANDTTFDVIKVSISLRLRLSDGSQAEIQTELVTNIDFAQVLGPPQTPVGSSLQRARRPLSLSLHSDATVSLQPRMNDDITISFSAPVEPVKVGRAFAWKVLVVNKTQNIARLAIIPLPRIQRPVSQMQQYARRHASKNSSISLKRGEKGYAPEFEDIAQPVIDENVIYAMQHSGGAPVSADIVSLTSELKIGPLQPGQCYEDEIHLVAFNRGPCVVDAIRVVDLQRESEEGPAAPGVVLDIKDLPDVLVED